MLSHKTINALKLYRDMLMNQGPRSLSCRPTDTWYFFTDATYEVDGDLPVAGRGGVLVSPVGKPVRFFSGSLTKHHIALLNPAQAKIIGPDNPTCSQFPSDTEFRQNAKFRKGI